MKITNGKEWLEWFVSALTAIRSGVADKLEKGGITIYKCGKIIRVDIKEEE